MQNALNLILVFIMLIIPGASIFMVFRANKRAEKAEEKTRDIIFRGLLDENKKQIDNASADDVAAIANSLYPKRTGDK